MDDRDSSATAQFDRLRSRFGGSDDDESDSSNKSRWKRYGTLFQVFVLVATAFGGALVGIASTALNRTRGFVRASGPELLDIVFPVLMGITLVAVAVCLVVVALGVRNV